MDVGQVVSIGSDLVVSIAAALALYIGWRQIAISREMSALDAYESYHIICLQHPIFSAGLLDFENASPQERDNYVVFVLFVLMTGERILCLFPDDASWIYSIEDDIRTHRRLISSSFFRGYLDNQSEAIRPLIVRVLNETV